MYKVIEEKDDKGSDEINNQDYNEITAIICGKK